MTRRRSDRVAKAASALALAAETYGEAVGDEVADIVASDQLEALKVQSQRDDLVLLRIESCETKLYAEMTELRAKVDGISKRLEYGITEMQKGQETIVERQFIKEQKINQLQAILERMDAAREAKQPAPKDAIDLGYQLVAELREAVSA